MKPIKYKDFLIQAAQAVIAGRKGGPDPLVTFAACMMEKSAPFPEMCPPDDPDREILRFTDKLRQTAAPADQQALCLALADLLDDFARCNQYWFIVPYDRFYISADTANTLFFNWLELESFCTAGQHKIDREIRLQYQDVLSPRLNSGIVKTDLLDLRLTVEAFMLTLIKLVCPKLPPASRLPLPESLKVGLTHLNMAPEEKYFLLHAIQSAHQFSSCREIVEHLFTARAHSIVQPRAATQRQWAAGFHSLHGRNKKTVQNEDSYTVICSEDQSSVFVMVADGVSTADVGCGRIMATRILEAIEDRKDDLLDFMQATAPLATEAWLAEGRRKLTALLTQINQDGVDALNSKLPRAPASVAHPMSSTVILGLIDKDRVVWAHLGDSHIFYIHGDCIMRLNEEHNNQMDRIITYIEEPAGPAFRPMPDDSHLTRTLPMAEYAEAQNSFVPLKIEDYITFASCHPQPEAAILLATDGLLDSVGGTRNDIENEKAVLALYQEASRNTTDPRRVARQMVCLADDKGGVDDITLVLLTGAAKPPAAPKPPETPKLPETTKKFKRLS